MRIQDAIKNYFSYEGNNTEKKCQLTDLIITNLTQEAFELLSPSDKDAVSSIYKDVVASINCHTHPEWVKPSRLFTKIIRQSPLLQPNATDIELDKAFHLDEWEASQAEALQKIRAFIRGKEEVLDLQNLNLTSLPACLFTDPRFKNTLLEGNPLERFPKKLPICNICNDELFDEMAKIISIFTGNLTKKVFSENSFINTFNAFTSLSQDTAINKQTRALKEAQYERDLREYQRKREEDPQFEFCIPGAVKEDVDTFISLLSNKVSAESILAQNRSPDQKEAIQEYEKKIPLMKVCVQNLAKAYALARKYDDSLLKMFAKEPLSTILPSWKEDTSCSQREKAQKIRAFLKEQKDAFKSVIFLSLNDLQLSVIPPEIGLFTKLKMLSLNGNQITSIPPNIDDCSSLLRLDLDNNKITEIPPALFCCKKLHTLRLRHNQITVIPEEIQKMKQLQTLLLMGNPFPDSSQEYIRLRQLLPGCKLHHDSGH
jgi:hypothetical protein